MLEDRAGAGVVTGLPAHGCPVFPGSMLLCYNGVVRMASNAIQMRARRSLLCDVLSSDSMEQR